MSAIEHFDEKFLSVPNDYRLNWFSLNTDQDITNLKKYGIGGLTICVPYNNYLKSSCEWENYRKNVKACKEAGISLWIMDEWGYPSGMAGGLVVEENPELESMGLLMQKTTADGGESVTLELPEDALSYVYAAYYPLDGNDIIMQQVIPIPISGRQVKVTLPQGNHYAVCAFAKSYIFQGTHSEFLIPQWKYTGRYPNLLLAEATKSFIELTHEQYKANTPDFASTLRIFYGDEPSLTTVYIKFEGSRSNGFAYIAWSDNISLDFKLQHGYELNAYLPALFEGTNDISKIVRIQFYQTLADTLRINWTGQIAAWCASHGTNMSYHYVGEESLTIQVAHYGDLMHVMEPMQIPSVDMGLREPGSSRRGEITSARMVASVARHSGDKQTRAELDPLLGSFPDVKATMVALRNNSNYCFAMGLNNMTTYGDWMGNSAEYQEQIATYQYIGRIEMFLRGAVYQNNIAIYYPIETYQSEYTPSPNDIFSQYYKSLEKQELLMDLDEQLMQNQISASYLTPQHVLQATLDDGNIIIGKHFYDTLILVDVRVMSLSVAKRLEAFEQTGGKLIWLGDTPTIATNLQDTTALQTMFANRKVYPTLTQVLNLARERHDTALHITTGNAIDDKNLTAQVFENNDTKIYFIASLTEKTLIVDVRIDAINVVYAYNPTDGTSKQISLPAKLTLGSSEAWILTDKRYTN